MRPPGTRWLVHSTFFASIISVAIAGTAGADPASGVDALVYRPALDLEGFWSLESDRTLSALDLSWKGESSFGLSPLSVPVPGIGADERPDHVLNHVLAFHNLIALGLTSRLTVALDGAVYRADPGAGYGERGRYRSDQEPSSTGLISLRELSNIDPSGGFEPHGLSGPLDARVAAKLRLFGGPMSQLGAALLGVVRLPFGNEEMFLGDRDLVFEPKLALGWHGDGFAVLANAGAVFRRRSVLEAYDPRAGEMRTDARAVLDLGSELTVGIGAQLGLLPELAASAEVNLLTALPSAVSLGTCERFDGEDCSSMAASDYFAGQRRGDRTAYALLGLEYQLGDNIGLRAAGGGGLLGARSETLRFVAGISWRPDSSPGQRMGRDQDRDAIPDVADLCRTEPEDRDRFQDDDGCPDLDNDDDGVVDARDTCPLDPEDRDGFEDADGCPEPDNDGDGVLDVVDACTDQGEDRDGFSDEDGCPDEDNDGDLVADRTDQCPNDAETPNDFADDDGCPDERETGGPRLAADRIDLAGARIEFIGPRSAALSAASLSLLDQIADILRQTSVQVRIEVHVPRTTRSTGRRELARAARRDKQLSELRARAVLRYLVDQGRVPLPDLQTVGLGSARPRGDVSPVDAAQARIDFILIRQAAPL